MPIFFMEYEKMVDRLYLSLPKEALTKERFELPKPDVFIQGNKTIIRNFNQMVKAMNRPDKHLIKYITKETASAAVQEDGRLILNRKIYFDQVRKIFQSYLNTFVLCEECKKPDTKIIDFQGTKMLKCTACGATRPLKKL